MRNIFNLKRKRFVRLLPSVMLACGALLVLNASGIVHDAFAQSAAPPPADAMAAPATPPNHDFADDDGTIATAAQVDVLTSLSRRRSELDQEQSKLQIQSNILAATESRVDSKIAQLKALQAQITGLLAQRDAAQEDQIKSLVKTYSAMKPASAARILETMPDNVLIPVAQELKSDVLALILGQMNPDAAQKLTVKLASRLTLPETASALAPPVPPGLAPGVPGPQAQAASAPAPAAAAAAPAATGAKPGG